MFEPITEAEIAAFRNDRRIEQTAEYVRYPKLFRPPTVEGERKTALIVGAAAKRLPREVRDVLGDAEPDEVAFASEYGFGIGRMAALHLARRGWNVIGTYAGSVRPARQLELMLRAHFGASESRMLQLDVTDLDAVRSFVEGIASRHRLHAVIYAPSVQVRKERLEDVTREDFEVCMRGNCFAYAELMKGLLPRLLAESPEGAAEVQLRVAYVGSISGSGTPSPGRVAYCVSKAAGMEFTQNLSAAYAPRVMAFNYNVSIADTAATVDVRSKYAPIMAAESHVGRMLSAVDVAEGLVLHLVESSVAFGANIDATAGWRRQAL